jgi:predicted transposase/invertase (TIGR01784 family)
MTSRLQFIFLELPNSLPRALKPESTVLENFCYALHEMEHLTERPSELKEEIFRLLFESAEIAKFTAEEKARYEQNMTTERDIRNQITYARDKGWEKGREEGREEGIRLTALKMLENRVPVQTICKCTGMTEQEVNQLAQ